MNTPNRPHQGRAIAMLCALFLVGTSLRPTMIAKDSSHLTDEEQVEKGRYIVHQVSMCIDCHSPRGPDGRFIEDAQLKGSPLPFAATVPIPWAPVAPQIAGLPAGYDKESMITFLMSGNRPEGKGPVLPPMPAFRMSELDATAVTDYLMSLK